MAAFAVLFGTRHIDATEHQDGLMLAIATESIIKLVAFLAVGIFVTFVMFHGPVALFARALQQPHDGCGADPRAADSTTVCRHDGAVAVRDRACCRGNSTSPWSRTAARPKSAAPPGCFRLYLVLINLFVLPIAMAGLLTFPAGGVDAICSCWRCRCRAFRTDHAHRLCRRPVGRDRHGHRRDRSRSRSWCRTTS